MRLLKFRWLAMLMLGSTAILFVACGGGDDDATATSEPPAASGNNGGSSTNGVNPFLPGFGGDSSGNVDCSALATASGIPVTALGVGASDSPTSDFSMQLSEFFTDLIEDALSTDADATCFFEVSVQGEGAGVWMAYSLSESAGDNAPGLITQALSDAGVEADDASAFTANFGQGAFTVVGFEGIPSVDGESGGVLMISGQSIVVTAGSDFNSADDDSDDSGGLGDPTSGSGGLGDGSALDDLIASAVAGGGASGPSSGGGPAPTATSTPVIEFGTSGTLAGVAGDVSNDLELAMEAALGVALAEGTSFSTSAGTATTVIVTYDPAETITVDVSAALSDVVTDFGGTVDFTFATGGVTNITFSGATIAGNSVGGSLNVTDDEIAVTLQITG